MKTLRLARLWSQISQNYINFSLEKANFWTDKPDITIMRDFHANTKQYKYCEFVSEQNDFWLAFRNALPSNNNIWLISMIVSYRRSVWLEKKNKKTPGFPMKWITEIIFHLFCFLTFCFVLFTKPEQLQAQLKHCIVWCLQEHHGESFIPITRGRKINELTNWIGIKYFICWMGFKILHYPLWVVIPFISFSQCINNTAD